MLAPRFAIHRNPKRKRADGVPSARLHFQVVLESALAELASGHADHVGGAAGKDEGGGGHGRAVRPVRRPGPGVPARLEVAPVRRVARRAYGGRAAVREADVRRSLHAVAIRVRAILPAVTAVARSDVAMDAAIAVGAAAGVGAVPV